QRLELSQNPIGPPILGQLHRRSFQIAVKLFQLAFKFLEQSESICSCSSKAGDHTVVMELSNLARAVFHHGLAETDLAIPDDYDFPAAANREYGCTVYHNYSPVEASGSRITIFYSLSSILIVSRLLKKISETRRAKIDERRRTLVVR